GEVTSPDRTPTEVAACSDSDPGPVGHHDALLGHLKPLGIADLLASSVNRPMLVVEAKVSQECMTESVETSVTPLAAMVLAMSSSSANPCSSVSTAESAASLQLASPEPWAATVAPRACTAPTTLRTSSADHGAVPASGPSRYSLTRSA